MFSQFFSLRTFEDKFDRLEIYEKNFFFSFRLLGSVFWEFERFFASFNAKRDF